MEACAAGGACGAEDVCVRLVSCFEKVLEELVGREFGGDDGFVGEIGVGAILGLMLFEGEFARGGRELRVARRGKF